MTEENATDKHLEVERGPGWSNYTFSRVSWDEWGPQVLFTVDNLLDAYNRLKSVGATGLEKVYFESNKFEVRVRSTADLPPLGEDKVLLKQYKTMRLRFGIVIAVLLIAILVLIF